MNHTPLFAEVEVYQHNKQGEDVCGDAFFSRKLQEEGRVIGVVSDGLGSGIKASILANMTGTMALRFAASNIPISHSADIIMDTLPICRVRRISYATFTIVDAALHGTTRIVEMGNPPFLLIRDGKPLELEKKEIASQRWPDRAMQLSEFSIQPEDRLIVFSDGVSQAGLGSPECKLGWRWKGCAEFTQDRIQKHPHLSARQLAKDIVNQAIRKDPDGQAKDDTTCSVFYFRKPRRLLVLTGPPFDELRDGEIAQTLASFDGQSAVCGGTTANLISRELQRDIKTHLRKAGQPLPPPSEMDGIDLVTEGILTLTQTARYLEGEPVHSVEDGAAQLAELLRESDVIHFLVGTRVNEAHQDPTLPVDLEIRRNIVKRIQSALIDRYLKEVTLEYI
jgi:hypothetical protein